jgi:plastocyanin
MQIYALSTGSALAGAFSMLMFGLGTVPLMFGLGAASSALGRRFTDRAMAVGAVLVAVLGLSMLTQGASLSGLGASTSAAVAQGDSKSGSTSEYIDGVQVVKSTLSLRGYPNITVHAGTPVKWVINAPKGSITGCNSRFFIPEYEVEHTFEQGENIVEFLPEKAGKFQYSCWMGMIRATITVTE